MDTLTKAITDLANLARSEDVSPSDLARQMLTFLATDLDSRAGIDAYRIDDLWFAISDAEDEVL